MITCEEHGTKSDGYYVICKNEAGLETHYKTNQGFERWSEYNKAKQQTHYKDNEEWEWWREYNKAGLVTHYKDNEGWEWWKEYNKAGQPTHIKGNRGFDEVYKRHKCKIKNKGDKTK